MAAPTTVIKTAAVAIAIGQLVAMDDNSGAPGAFLADANGAAHRKNPWGIAKTAAAPAASCTIVVAGEQAVPDAYWTGGVPAVTDVGALVFMSETAGSVTMTAPTTSGDVWQKVGVVGTGGAGAATVIVQFGDGITVT